MTGTAVGLTGQEGRSTTTIMFTYPIRRSHQHAATILQGHRLQTDRGKWVGPVVWAGLVEWGNRGELAGQAVSGVREE